MIRKYNYDKDNSEIRIMGALQSTGKKKGPSTGVGGNYNRLVLMDSRFSSFELITSYCICLFDIKCMILLHYINIHL
jgi:hypothetical protein